MNNYALRGVLALGLVLGTWTSGNVTADSTADLYLKAAKNYQDLDRRLTNNDHISVQAEILKESSRIPDDYDDTFRHFEDIIGLISRAAKSNTCDWNLDLSQGLLLELPHTQELNTCHRIIRRDLMRQMVKADLEKIGDRMVTAYSIPHHLGPGMYLTTLVAASQVNNSNLLLDEVVDHGLIDPIQATRILDAVNKFPKNDPFQLRDAFRNERDLILASIQNSFDTADQGEWDEDDVYKFAMTFNISNTNLEKLLEGRGDLLPGLKQYWRDAITGEESKTDAQLADHFEVIETQAAEGKYGALTQFMSNGPSNAKIIRKMSQSAEDLNERRALLQQIANGHVDIMSRANAAPWYAKAIRRSEDSEIPWWEDDEIRRDVLANLAIASTAGRCEFAYPNDYFELREVEFMRWKEHVIPWWLPAMDGFMAYFLQASDTALETGDMEQAIANLRSTCRIITHMAQDPGLSSSIIAGNRCMNVLDRVEALHSAGLGPRHRGQLLDALRGIPTTDPFGLVTATKASQHRLQYQLVLLHASGSLPELEAPEDPDDVLYAMAWLQDLSTSMEVNELWYWPQYGTWPDDLPGDPAMVQALDSAAIKATSEDGQRAQEAWKLKVHVPLETARDIATPSAATLSDQGRLRLIKVRRQLR
ncbi:MAG: hypothetical protein VX527_06135 [Planctomycetota bacterium]|nr:hypothetical protein [Planctomycetota bacterium]